MRCRTISSSALGACLATGTGVCARIIRVCLFVCRGWCIYRVLGVFSKVKGDMDSELGCCIGKGINFLACIGWNDIESGLHFFFMVFAGIMILKVTNVHGILDPAWIRYACAWRDIREFRTS